MKSEETRHYQRRTADQWKGLVEHFNQCDQSGAAYCRENGIAYASFCTWRQRLSSSESLTTPNNESSAPAFIDLNLLAQKSMDHAQNTSWNIVLKLGNGVELCLSQLNATS